MTTKAAEVFAIPELLEQILLELPNQDLLLAQRTNKTFRDAILGSRRIQRALFFRTSAPSSQTRPRLNPLLHKIFDCSKCQYEIEVADKSCKWYAKFPNAGKHELSKSVHHVHVEKRAALLVEPGSDATWRGMLLSDPPSLMCVTDGCISRCHEGICYEATIGKLLPYLSDHWKIKR